FFKTASKKYKEDLRRRRAAQPDPAPVKDGHSDETLVEEVIASRATTTAFESAESMARSEVEDYINALGPYEFQDLVAALLRGMGYYTPFVAPAEKTAALTFLHIAIHWGALP